jgi:hypothetical protein
MYAGRLDRGDDMANVNLVLAEQQGLDDADHEKLQALYNALDDLLTNPENYDNPVNLIEQVEFKLQKVWKFPQDARYHTHWVKIKGCTCPKLDNKNYFGSNICLINQMCPWHSTRNSNV